MPSLPNQRSARLVLVRIATRLDYLIHRASQPTLEKNAVNGLPAVNFDGTDDFMTFTLPIDGLTGMTIILVSAATQDVEPPWPYCANAAIFWNETASWGTAHLTPLQSGVWLRFGTGQTQPLPVQYQYKSPIGEKFTIAAAVMDGITDYLYINGELVLTNEKPAGQEALGHQRDAFLCLINHELKG